MTRLDEIKARDVAGQPLASFAYYAKHNLWDAYLPFIEEATADRHYLLGLLTPEALSAALRKANRAPQFSCTIDHRDQEGKQIGCPDGPKRHIAAILAALEGEQE